MPGVSIHDWTGGWVDDWTGGRMHGWMTGQVDGWMEEQTYQDKLMYFSDMKLWVDGQTVNE